MVTDAGVPAGRRRLSPRTRRAVVRLAEVACPPEARSPDLAGGLVTEFEALLGAAPAEVRWLIRCGLAAFDQGARLRPSSRGRRFARLPADQAEAYFAAVLTGRFGVVLQRIKGLVVFCYYELPSVKEHLGYRPEPYIAEVSRRRLVSYGEEIRAGELAVFEADAP